MTERKISPFRITQWIFSAIVTVALVLSGLNGLWHRWWVEWLLIPITLLAFTVGIFELCRLVPTKLSTKSAVAISACSFLLLGGLAICAYRFNPPLSVREWQPPELPEGCKSAIFSFADENWPINLDDIKNRQPFVPPDIKLPKTERAKSLISSLPTIFFKNNRLYVRVVGVVNGVKVISDPFILDEKLPWNFDRNYSANAFEMVDQNTTPMLQVIYEKPNEVRVNGVFRGDKEGKIVAGFVWVVFGTSHRMYFPKDAIEERLILDTCKTNILFKYPSFNHLGEYAD